MIKQKRYYLLILFILAISGTFQLTGCGSVGIHADYPFYADEQSLIDKADLIITGVVVNVHKPEKIDLTVRSSGEVANEEDKTLVTVSEIEVIDVIKGDVKVGDIIEVKQLGDKNGMAEEYEMKVDGYFKKDSQYVLFLMDFNDLIPGIPYSTLSPMQGQIKIVDGKTEVNELNALYKSGENSDEFVKALKEKVNKGT